ncbi:hypothetical protein PybrP1_001128 [[Pythium] brassicae (nom. inval.)]|nr:hypothetical protein PybrP1_001128 [[Pythium] brassicae (nom. inval.)]
MRRTLLLSALLLAFASAQSAAGSGASDVLVTMSVDVDGSFRNLQLLRGESVEAAAASFARSNGLVENRDDAAVRQVIDQLSGMLKGRMAELQATQTVQLALPLTVDGYSGELKKYESESIDAAVERFLYDTGLNMDAMRELYPQLVAIVEQKLAELQPPRKELFSFEITIDGASAVVRHFEGGSPVEEAMHTLRTMNIREGEQMDRLVPQLANEITRQLAAAAEETRSEPPHSEPQRSPAPTELFSIPLTINSQAAVLVHLDGMTARETALRFLNENGITDPADVGRYLPQLVDIVDARMSEYLRDEAAAQVADVAPAPAPAPSRRLLLTLPVNLGDNRSANLEYYEGDSVERTVELFLAAVGLAESPSFSDSVAQLAGVVRQRLAAQQQEDEQQALEAQRRQQQQQRELELQQQQAQAPATAPQAAPLVSLPVTLSGLVYTLEYFKGQDVGLVANAFCVEKHELVRAELGLSFDGDQLQECKRVLVTTLRERLAAGRQPAPPASGRGDLLFTLDIDDGEGGSYQLPFHRNDDVRAVATAFCEQHGLDLSNVPALEHGIQSQLAQR